MSGKLTEYERRVLEAFTMVGGIDEFLAAKRLKATVQRLRKLGLLNSHDEITKAGRSALKANGAADE